MKLTKTKLKQIIKEEISSLLEDDGVGHHEEPDVARMLYNQLLESVLIYADLNGFDTPEDHKESPNLAGSMKGAAIDKLNFLLKDLQYEKIRDAVLDGWQEGYTEYGEMGEEDY